MIWKMVRRAKRRGFRIQPSLSRSSREHARTSGSFSLRTARAFIVRAINASLETLGRGSQMQNVLPMKTGTIGSVTANAGASGSLTSNGRQKIGSYCRPSVLQSLGRRSSRRVDITSLLPDDAPTTAIGSDWDIRPASRPCRTGHSVLRERSLPACASQGIRQSERSSHSAWRRWRSSSEYKNRGAGDSPHLSHLDFELKQNRRNAATGANEGMISRAPHDRYSIKTEVRRAPGQSTRFAG